MYEVFIKRWWVFLLRGLVAILFGVLALIWPRLTLLTLVILFGAFVLLDGIFSVIAGFSSKTLGKRWWIMLLSGLLGIAIGLLTFIWPNITGIVLLYLIASWAVVMGIMDIIVAIQLRKEISNEWMLLVDGGFSVIIGFMLFLFPGASALALVWLIGVFAIFLGIIFIFLAFRLRNLAREIEKFS